MLYVFFGTDTVGVREEAYRYVERFVKEGMRVEKIEAENYQYGMLQDASGATSLFGEKTLYVVDTPEANDEMAKDLALILEELPSSTNTFIVIEGALKAEQTKRYRKYTEEVVEAKAPPKERYNAFKMAEALLRKDKKSLWILLNEAKANGLSAEEIVGVLWWQLKMLRLAERTKSAEEAGMKEYPYKKAKQALSTFKKGETEMLSHSLLSLYHEGHAGTADIDLALERFVLTL